MAEIAEDKVKTVGRKRGRPRTVTDDHEVPERRRKQLRLAQQAYRKRKETTIGNLQNRVQELETGIEDLSHSFLSFSNLLIEEQLLSQYPRIAAALQNITQQCVALAKAGSEEPTEVALVHATKKPQIKMAATPDNNTAPSLVLVNTPSETSTDVEDIIRSATRWPGPPTPPYQDPFSLPFGIVMPSPTTELPYVTPPLSNSPTLDLLSNNIVEERQWTIAQRIVQACCQNGYRLLVDTPNHSRVQQIFGSMLGLSERNRLISGFYAATQDKLGDLIEPKANVLTALRSNMNTFSEDQLHLSPRIWQIALESTSGEWMDANGAQRYLRDKRMIFENFTDSSGPDYSVSSSLDVKSFIKFLSTEAICVGNGPVFRRQSVDKAIRLATINVPWDFDNLCDL